MDLNLANRGDLALLAEAYHSAGRIRLPDLLIAADAEALAADLIAREDWWQLQNRPEGVLELSRRTRARMGAKRRAALDEALHARARQGFQYRYEGLRVPDDPADMADPLDPLAALARLMRSTPLLDLFGTVLGRRDLHFTDGQATAYSPGDFLTCHDDGVAGRGRVAAVVLGLTRGWRADWGGLLLFHEDHGTMSGLVPGFNTLDLFAVPQLHSVSLVSPAAPCARYAITGWLAAAPG